MSKREQRGGSLLGFFTRCFAVIGGLFTVRPIAVFGCHPRGRKRAASILGPLAAQSPPADGLLSPAALTDRNRSWQVAGIVDSLLYHSSKQIKIQLNKAA